MATSLAVHHRLISPSSSHLLASDRLQSQRPSIYSQIPTLLPPVGNDGFIILISPAQFALKYRDYVSSAVFSCHGILSFSLLKAFMPLLNPLCFSDQGSQIIPRTTVLSHLTLLSLRLLLLRAIDLPKKDTEISCC